MRFVIGVFKNRFYPNVILKIVRFGKDDADLYLETETGNLISFVSKFSVLFAYTNFDGLPLLFESRIVQDRLVSMVFYF